MSVAGLLLGDSRFPAGGHAHSGGVEAAVTAGTVVDLGSLEVFLRGRLRTTGLVAAGIAAAACEYAQRHVEIVKYPECRGALAPDIPDDAALDGSAHGSTGSALARRRDGRTLSENPVVAWDDGFWAELDAEVDARTPSPAQRDASRRQGRALLRAARAAWPGAAGLTELAGSAGPGYRGGPHHAVVLGAAAAAAGAEPAEAARIAAYQAVAGPVSAAVRLLALDPMRATGVLARLAGEIDQVAEFGAAHAGGPLSDLPCASAPGLDLLAEAHVRAEVRLFES